jgi:hypothetical protein
MSPRFASSSLALTLVGVAIGLCSLPSCWLDKSCSEVGCYDGITFTAPMPAAIPAGGLRFEVCRNGICDERDISASSADFTAADCDFESYCIVENGQVYVHQSVTDFMLFPDPDSDAGDFVVDASTEAPLENGDRVTVRLFDPATNTTYASTTQTVTYGASYPNGQSCAPSCKTATIAATSM